jgi:hypothetical protein
MVLLSLNSHRDADRAPIVKKLTDYTGWGNQRTSSYQWRSSSNDSAFRGRPSTRYDL